MKNVLLAVCGLSPQVITETLYALHQNGREVHAIHVITTRDGKEKLFATLLAPMTGHYCCYLNEYGIEPGSIDFGHHNVHVIQDRYGNELPDIACESDNEVLLRTCLELAFCLTRDNDSAVFFSVAGGRKTMGSCLTLAAQMYGRPQDRIYHVLVSPEFEGNRDFFYPPRTSKLIQIQDQNSEPVYKETKYAQVNLIPMPFVSIRNHLSAEVLRKPLDPATLMLSLIREERTRLLVNLVQKKVVYRGMELDLMPARLALYAFFVMKKKNCTLGRSDCGICADCFLDINGLYEAQSEITDIYNRLAGRLPMEVMSDTGITNLNADNFNSYKAKIRHDLLQRFGPYAMKDMEIASIGPKGNVHYGIRLDRERIEIVY